MSVRMSPTVVLTAVAHDAAVVHTTATGLSHSVVQDNTVICTCAGVDLLSAVSEVSAALNGNVAKKFKPTRAIVRLTNVAGGAATGDSHVQIGSATTTADILASTHLTGLQTVGQCFIVNLTGLFPSIAGNANLFAQCVTVDGGAATTLTATVEIEGVEI